jgi:hypothetical protein
VKARVLGLNAAELFGLDPQASRCVLAADMLTESRPVQRELAALAALPAPWVPRRPFTRGQILRWRAHEKVPGSRPDQSAQPPRRSSQSQNP